MKIAIFSDCYLDLTGGIVSSINAQKHALEQNGHEVAIFTTAYPKSAKELKCLAKDHIYVVPSCKYLIRGATPVSRRPKIVEDWLTTTHPELQEYDIFYIHYEAGCSIAGLRLGKRLRIPTVQVMHGREDMGVTSIIPRGFRTFVATALNWFHSWYLPHPVRIKKDTYLADTTAKVKMWTMMVNHANYADYVVCPSHHFAKKLKHYGVKHQIHIVPNGYPDANFPPNPPVKSLQSGEPLNIIWHSRLSGEKRIIPFLQALAQLEKTHRLDSTHQTDALYHLDIYGDGPDRNKAVRFVRRHHLNVTFHGATPFKKVQQQIQQSHLDILASYNFDNYPMTLVEAEACGVPCLICDPDMREIIPEGGYILSKSDSPEDMAKALNDLLTHPDRIAKMSKTMLQHRRETLISVRIKSLLDLFVKITEHNNH